MIMVGRCGAYGKRPDFCKKYPSVTDNLLEGCTYSFHNGERIGTCQPEVCQENNCCSYPREGGEPEGKSLDHFIGGMPCKHLVWDEVDEMEKDASSVELSSFDSEMQKLAAEALHNVR